MKKNSIYYNFVLTAMFIAIIIILAFTPVGFIQMGLIKATIIHIPVILGSIILGPKYGAVLGLVFGFTSLVSNTINPAILSFAFSPVIPVPGTGQGSYLALIVCFLPRILVGIVPYYVYKLFKKIFKNKDWLSFGIAGVVGSMTNTFFVLNIMYFLFQNAYATAKNISVDAVYNAIITIMVVNGIPEALVAGVLIGAIGKTVKIQSNAKL